MKKVQQDMMCVLLQTLLDKKLISQEIYERSREKILDTLVWPEVFCDAKEDGEEEARGYPQNPCANANGKVHL